MRSALLRTRHSSQQLLGRPPQVSLSSAYICFQPGASLRSRAIATTSGAPYTNSLHLRKAGDEYTLEMCIPDAPHGTATVMLRASDPLAALSDAVRTHSGGRRVDVVANGSKVAVGALRTLHIGTVNGQAVEIEVDGVRWSINAGQRIDRAPKKGRAFSSLLVLGGFVGALTLSLLAWRTIIPPHLRRF